MKLVYRIFLAFVFLFLFFSCVKKENSGELNKAITWEKYSSTDSYIDPRLTTELDTIEERYQCEVAIELLFPEIDNEKLEPLQEQLRNFLLDRFVFEGEGEKVSYESGHPQKFVDDLVRYRIDGCKRELDELNAHFSQENLSSLSLIGSEYYLKDTLLYNDHGIVSIGQNSYEFSGGAHDMTLFTIRSFNLSTKEPITLSTLFQDPQAQGILEAIENQFLLDYEVDNLRELQDQTGLFSLTGSEIVISNEFYFSEDGITFYYNHYEIAPYANGASMVTVPYKVLEPFFRSEYQFLAKK